MDSAADKKDIPQRLPSWFKVKLTTGPRLNRLQSLIRQLKLNTVCEEARCPNLWDCWNRGTATFMILGDTCTRSCGFCAVKTGRPTELDEQEPERVAEAISKLNLRHAVITSVNRDELSDGGAGIFAETIRKTRQYCACTIEVLIPDFKGDHSAQDKIFAARPDILNHNTETVPRLYRTVRPQAKYDWSLDLLSRAKAAGLKTKTGLMLGLGESKQELLSVIRDLVSIRCDILTLGQYLQPTKDHLSVVRFYDPDEFNLLKVEGEKMGIPHVESGPLVRSSYHAEEQATGAV